MENILEASRNEAQAEEEEKKTLDKIEKEITALLAEGYSLSELDQHIEKMHEYNEIKDATQIILGHLAILEGVSIKEMHEKFDLTFSD